MSLMHGRARCVENNFAALLVDATPARRRVISTQVLDDPHCLPCAHAFCKDCILRAFETTRPGHGHECPVCRAPCRKRSIQPAAQLRALVDIVRRAEAAAAPAEASEDAEEAEAEDEDEAEESVQAPPSPAPPASPPAAAPSPVAAEPSPVRSPEEEATLARVRGTWPGARRRAAAATSPVAARPGAARRRPAGYVVIVARGRRAPRRPSAPDERVAGRRVAEPGRRAPARRRAAGRGGRRTRRSRGGSRTRPTRRRRARSVGSNHDSVS